jgi:hypothetical protein
MPLVLVSALTGGDFWLWNWSLSANRDVLALVSGLTLLPLAAACLLLFVLTAARIAARFGWRSAGAAVSRRTVARGRPYVSSSRAIGSPTRRTVEPGLAFEQLEQDDGGLVVGASGRRSAKPARKLAA